MPPPTYDCFCLHPSPLDIPVIQGNSAEDVLDSELAAHACLCPGVMLKGDRNHKPVHKGSRYMRISPNFNELHTQKNILCSVFLFLTNLVLVVCKSLDSKILRFRSWLHIYTTTNLWPYEVISITLPLPQAGMILESSLNGSLSKEAICSFIKLLIILA